jgi:hypothetical protein
MIVRANRILVMSGFTVIIIRKLIPAHPAHPGESGDPALCSEELDARLRGHERRI